MNEKQNICIEQDIAGGVLLFVCVILLAFGSLIACSSCKRVNESVDVPTVEVDGGTTSDSDAGTTTETTTSEPKPIRIDWRSPLEVSTLVKVNPELCLFVYFPDVVNNDKRIEEVLSNEELSNKVNELFLSMKFPIAFDNATFVMKEFGIEKLPALIIAPANDQTVLQVEGNVERAALLQALVDGMAPGKIFSKCAEAKAKLNWN